VSAVRLSIGSILAVFALTPLAHAQLEGSGWEPYESGAYLQFQRKNSSNKERYTIRQDKTIGGATYDWNSATKTETFKVTSTTSYDRLEYRGRSYSEGSGVYQLQGEIFIPSNSNADGYFVAQFFHSGLIKYTDGDLRYHPATLADPDDREAGWNRDGVGDAVTIASNVKGKWVKVNIIHDVRNRKVRIYIDNSIKINRSSYKIGNNAEYYFKYGVYNTSGSDAEIVQWRNVKVWKK
jgi:hypothetical protein